jgi:O-antigen/teichoic acid export membrane protein
MIRSRSLRSNSLTSLLASGGVFALTLATTAVLARTISTDDYKLYATVIAFLPLALLLSQSVRNCAGSVLIVAMQSYKAFAVRRVYRNLVFSVTIFTAICAISAILIYSLFGKEIFSSHLEIGVICLTLYVSGITISLLTTGPLTAAEDFIPENLLKIIPQLTSFFLFLLIYYINPINKILWVFISFASSSWPLLFYLRLRYKNQIRYFFNESENLKQVEEYSQFGSPRKFIIASFVSVAWWNIAAYFATSVAIAVVAIFIPSYVASFGMAFSLIGVLSGGLIAISSPLASRIASIPLANVSARLSAFRRFNSYCILYISAVAFFVLILPEPIYELWVGPHYAPDVHMLTLYLLPATILRLLTMCFTLFVMGCGRQSTLWLSPLLEAAGATAACVGLGYYLGIEGIALALLFSAAIRLAATLLHDIRLNRDVLPITWQDLLIPRMKFATQ